MESLEQLVARKLSVLVGKAFETAVCAYLQGSGSFFDFQTIPDPDGGVDGLSHKQTRGYLMYGPDIKRRGTKELTRKLVDATVKKFRSDFRRILELEGDGAKQLKVAAKPNTELQGIMAKGNRMSHVHCIVSAFDSGAIIGPLNESFAKYLAVSENRFVSPDATMTIWGPTEVAARGVPSSSMIALLEHGGLQTAVNAALSSVTVAPDNTSDFDEKFDHMDLVGRKTTGLRQTMRQHWSKSIAYDKELSDTSPDIHARLVRIRSSAALAAQLASVTSAQPAELLKETWKELKQQLDDSLGDRLTPEQKNEFAIAETARLIGECHLDWRPQSDELD